MVILVAPFSFATPQVGVGPLVERVEQEHDEPERYPSCQRHLKRERLSPPDDRSGRWGAPS